MSIKVGAVGVGGIFNLHLSGWKTIPDVEIVAVCDIDPKVAKKVAEEAGAKHVFTDFKDLMKLDLDIVDICTPNKIHTPVVMAALESGKHVICEKPLAVSVKEVKMMGELADKKKLKLMTAQNNRFRDITVALKDWSKENLGEVYYARVRATRRALLPPRVGFIDKRLSGGGPCVDIGVHSLDACMWIMNFPTPVRVTGVTKVNFAKGYTIPGMWGEWDRKLFSVEDFAVGFVVFDNGATLTLEASWLGHQQENEDMSFQLFGTKAGVKWPSGEFASVSNGIFYQGTITPKKQSYPPHTQEIHAFVDCVVNNKPSPVPWTETIKVIAILEGIYKSAKTGREVKIKI